MEFETSSDEEESDTILNQNGLPLDRISSVPSSRFSGEIPTLRRDWEHISGIVSEHQRSENEEDERTPFYDNDSEEGRLSNSASLPDRYSDGSSGVMNESIDGELDRGEEDDGGIEIDVGGARANSLITTMFRRTMLKITNQEDLAKVYHILHKGGLYGPLTELTEDGAKVTDQSVQCNGDPPRISPDSHSGHGGGHSHQEVGGAHLHETTLPLPRHMSSPHSKFP